MNSDDYLKMLNDRIKECEYNAQVAHRAYVSETTKLKAAVDAKDMYKRLLVEGKLK